MARCILIAVTRDEHTNESQSFQVGRPTTWARALNRFDGHADRQFYRESSYFIAGRMVNHFAVRTVDDDHDWRLKGMIPVRVRDMVKIDTPERAIVRTGH